MFATLNVHSSFEPQSGEIIPLIRLSSIIRAIPLPLTSDIVDLYLDSIRVHLIPSCHDLKWKKPVAVGHASRGFISSVGLWEYMRTRRWWKADESRIELLVRTVREKVLPQLSEIVHWFTFFIDHPPSHSAPHIYGNSTALTPIINPSYYYAFAILLGDEGLSQELIQHPDSIALASRLWILQYKDVPGSSDLFLQPAEQYFTLIHESPLEDQQCPLPLMVAVGRQTGLFIATNVLWRTASVMICACQLAQDPYLQRRSSYSTGVRYAGAVGT